MNKLIGRIMFERLKDKISPAKFFAELNLNRWIVLSLVAVTSLLITAYIDNVLKVNNLLSEVRALESRLSEVRASNELLNSKLISLQSAERITKIAEEKLGMKKPDKAPTVIR